MRHLKKFNEGIIKSAKVMSDDEIESDIKKQNHNIENFKDIFDKLDEISKFTFLNSDEKSGSFKTIQIIKNYLLNRKIN